jgi:hypothetical protein
MEATKCVKKRSMSNIYIGERGQPSMRVRPAPPLFLLFMVVVDAPGECGNKQFLCVVNDQPVGNPKRKV